MSKTSLTLTPRIADSLRKVAAEVVDTLGNQPTMRCEGDDRTFGANGLDDRERLLLRLAQGLLLALDEVDALRKTQEDEGQ